MGADDTPRDALPTLADVARAAGVHKSTASRALRTSGARVEGATAERVRGVARELGYLPNPAASSLRSRRTRTIGVIVPRLTDLVMALLYEELAASCERYGYHALVDTTAEDDEAERAAVQVLRERRVDGLVLSTAKVDTPSWRPPTGLPYVLVLRTDGHGPAVTGDDRLGGYLATRHLLDLGHRRIAMAAGPDHATSALCRRDGYRAALDEAGIDVDERLIIPSTFSMESGEHVGRELLGLPRPQPTAVFAVNDNTAVGVGSVLSRAGLTVPDDMSVVGYNDIPLAARLATPLTTVRVPFREIATSSVATLLDPANVPANGHLTHAPTLIPRASTARLD